MFELVAGGGGAGRRHPDTIARSPIPTNAGSAVPRRIRAVASIANPDRFISGGDSSREAQALIASASVSGHIP